MLWRSDASEISLRCYGGRHLTRKLSRRSKDRSEANSSARAVVTPYWRPDDRVHHGVHVEDGSRHNRMQ